MKLHSYTITQGKDRAPARAFLKAIGFTDEDMKKPIIGIANTWIGTMPCNFKLRELAVRRGGRHPRKPAARPWSTTPSPSATASPWAPKA